MDTNMTVIPKTDDTNKSDVRKDGFYDDWNLIELSGNRIADARRQIETPQTLTVPIAELAVLGGGIASLLPAFQALTQRAALPTEGLYRLANASAGDTLKVAKNGNFWGAFKTAEGGSKFAQLQQVTPNQVAMSINPATIMMAAALFSIERQLKGIRETQKQILSFLETEKEAEIEADVETLSKLVANYKHNWNNELFVNNNHTQVLDIKRTARKNMISYQKRVSELLEAKQLIVMQSKVRSTLTDLQKKYAYYRLSLYAYSLACLVEIMLSGNFDETYIDSVRTEISERSLEYRTLFTSCSEYLERLSSGSVESNVLKGLGTAGKAVGRFVGKVPIAQKHQVDEHLQEGGAYLQDSAQEMANSVLKTFSAYHDPGTEVFVKKMDEMIRIYNHTSSIYVDWENIYLLTE